MASLRPSSMTLGYVAASAIAVAALGGCSGSAHLARAGTYGERDAVRAKHGADKGVTSAEREVARSPQNASLRSALGLAYLQAGRFDSATSAFDDAVRLGENSPRTALSLALAKIGAGRGREAIAILDNSRDSIPAGDLGLALALAGEGSRGVAILTDALRGGDNSAKLRQNLAYAYALDGRWREARTMMEQDVPADLVDRRISEWAMQGKAEDYQKRVAGLLGAPVRSDPGLPQQLALVDSAPVEKIAAEATAAQPQSVAQPVSASDELPPAGEIPPTVPSVAMASETIPAPAPYTPVAETAPVVQPAETTSFANAFDAPATPVLQASNAWRTPRAARRTARVVLPAAKPVVTRTGSHLVQLGSFSSPQGARRGWGILTARNPRLREYRMVITPAVVNSKNFWRVAAAGFDANAAVGMCSMVRNRGGVCFAYAANRVPAGALPAQWYGVTGPRMARRR